MKKKKLTQTLSLVGVMSLFQPVEAQSFKNLWKDVEKELKMDLPKKAEVHINEILNKAKEEKNVEQQIKALAQLFVVKSRVSEDSAQTVMRQLESFIAQQSSIDRAVGYAIMIEIFREEKDRDAQLKQWVKSVFVDMKALSKAKVTHYKELIEPKGNKSYYDSSLLYFFIKEVLLGNANLLDDNYCLEQIDNAIRLSQQEKLSSAVLMLELIRQDYLYDLGRISEEEYKKSLNELRKQYQGFKANVITYIELTKREGKNDTENKKSYYDLLQEGMRLYGSEKACGVLKERLDKCISAQVKVIMDKEVNYPNETITLPITYRNIHNVSIDIYNITDCKWLEERNKQKVEKRIKSLKPVLSMKLKYNPSLPYKFYSDSLSVKVPDIGEYALVVNGNSKKFCYFAVSKLYPFVTKIKNKELRVRALDRKTGHEIGEFSVQALGSNSTKKDYLSKDGVCEFLTKGTRGLKVAKGLDQWCPKVNVYGYDYNYEQGSTQCVGYIEAFMDRKVFRGGQNVQVASIYYQQEGDHQEVVNKRKVTFTWRNANYKKIGTTTVLTNEFGVASTSYALATDAMPGNYSVEVQVEGTSIRNTLYFEVIAYKRPSFEVKLQMLKEGYRVGDSVEVRGVVKSFSGVPLRQAHVSCKLDKTFLMRDFSKKENQVYESTTNDKGEFSVKIKLGNAVWAKNKGIDRSWYSLRADVTSNYGETQTGVLFLPVGMHTGYVETSFPTNVNKDKLPLVDISRVNAGNQLLSGEGVLTIKKGQEKIKTISIRSGQKPNLSWLKDLPSGEYTVEIKFEDCEKRIDFYLFSMNDNQYVGNKEGWFYEEDDEGRKQIVVGTNQDSIEVFFDFYPQQGESIHEKYVFKNKEQRIFTLHYQSSYGEGARALWTFVRNGKRYSYDALLLKPLPKKHLTMKWKTFRSLLEPGAREKWKLQVSDKNGNPVSASVISTLYDASLHKFVPNVWNYNPVFERKLPNVERLYNGEINGEFVVIDYSKSKVDLTYLLGGNWRLDTPIKRFFMGEMVQGPILETKSVASMDREVKRLAPSQGNNLPLSPRVENNLLRTNFSETALFLPYIETDKQGIATINVEMPHSTTTWDFQAFAHDKNMNYSLLRDTIVTRRQFMVKPNVPVFVREGDRFSIPVSLQNLYDKSAKVLLSCKLYDAKNQQLLLKKSLQVSIGPNSSENRLFEFTVPASLVALRVVIDGVGSDFGDSEEHLIPVLPSSEMVMRTLPFELMEKGVQSLRIDTLFEKSKSDDALLTIEATSNPIWYVVGALPVLMDKECYGVNDWSQRLYALSVSSYIAQRYPEIGQLVNQKKEATKWGSVLERNPELKQILIEQSPWQNEAEDETSRLQQLGSLFDLEKNAQEIEKALKKIKQYQNSDKGLSWFKGMPSNIFTTLEVAKLLARQEFLTGDQKVKSFIESLWEYANQWMTDNLLKEKKKELSHIDYAYLHLSMYLKKSKNATISRLLNLLNHSIKEQTIYGKSMSALILAYYGERKVALENVESLMEYLVKRQGMGMYFDSRKAQLFYDSYRLSSQCAALEALETLTPQRSEVIEQMKLWLMQSKRTQVWLTPQVTVDAIDVLLRNPKKGGVIPKLSSSIPLRIHLMQGNRELAQLPDQKEKASPLSGYLYHSYSGELAKAERISIEKFNSGISWGSVYARFKQSFNDLQSYGKDLYIKEHLEVWRNGNWHKVEKGERLSVGERVRQVCSFKADRDFDFVSLIVPRPANIQPKSYESGYDCDYPLFYYKVVKDTSEEFYFENLCKGTHTIAIEGFIDRVGTYKVGTARIQSIYAPEFVGNSLPFEIES